MDWRAYVRERLPRLEVPATREIEIIEELAAQLAATYERECASGATDEEAARRVEEEVPDWQALASSLAESEPREPARFEPLREGETGLLESIRGDLAQAIRSVFAWRPWPWATAMLALSLGAVLTVAAAADAWLIRRSAMTDTSRLTFIWGTNHTIGQRRDVISGPTFLDLQRQATSFDTMAVFASGELVLKRDGRPEVISLLRVTSEFFDVSGTRALAGRNLQASDAAAPDRAIMISQALWQRLYGGDPSAVGRTLGDLGQPHEIVGVLPTGFGVLESADAITLIDPRAMAAEPRTHYYYWAIGRLQRGRSLADAQDDLDRIMARLASEHPVMRGWEATAESLHSVLIESIRPSLWILTVIAALVLIIGVANTANLAVSRSLERRREVAIRSALGSTRARIRRQWMLEGLLLAALAAACGAGIARAAIAISRALVPHSAAIASSAATVELPPLEFGWPMVALAIAGALAIALVLGGVPIRSGAVDVLRGGRGVDATGDARVSRSRAWLLVVQITVATLLTAVASSLLMLVAELSRTAPGFDGTDVTVIQIGAVHDLDAPSRAQYYRSVLERVSATPGVDGAALNDYIPLTNEDDYEGLEIPGRARDANGQLPREEWRRVSPTYFQTMRMPVLRGRGFSEADDRRAASVVVVNESMARKYWPGADPVGSRIRITSAAYGWSEVIGIVGDVREAGLDRPSKPMMFVPYDRDPRPVMGLFVKTRGQSAAMTDAVRNAVWAVDPARPIAVAGSMTGIVGASYAIQRTLLSVSLVLAALALVLVLGGTYAIVSLATSARVPEIGLRIALGAGARQVALMVLSTPIGAAAVGLSAGLGAAVVGVNAIARQINGLHGLTLATSIGSAAIVLGIVAAACIPPARRALGVDPSITLRNE